MSLRPPRARRCSRSRRARAEAAASYYENFFFHTEEEKKEKMRRTMGNEGGKQALYIHNPKEGRREGGQVGGDL